MMDKDLVKRRLAELRKNLEALRVLRGFGLEDLRKDLKISWAMKHGLQLSIQIIGD